MIYKADAYLALRLYLGPKAKNSKDSSNQTKTENEQMFQKTLKEQPKRLVTFETFDQ